MHWKIFKRRAGNFVYLPVLAAVGLSLGCSRQPQRKSAVSEALTGNPNIQRFILVNNNLVPSGFLAMDTQTGRLCRTWDWDVPDTSPLAGKGINHLDTCRELLGHDDLWLAH